MGANYSRYRRCCGPKKSRGSAGGPPPLTHFARLAGTTVVSLSACARAQEGREGVWRAGRPDILHGAIVGDGGETWQSRLIGSGRFRLSGCIP
jgi:hypothetical protein